jgi:hypothetical protein
VVKSGLGISHEGERGLCHAKKCQTKVSHAIKGLEDTLQNLSRSLTTVSQAIVFLYFFATHYVGQQVWKGGREIGTMRAHPPLRRLFFWCVIPENSK